MASLARSLLALAVLALLQAACALHPEYYPPNHRSADARSPLSCSTFMFGKRNDNPDREIIYELPPIHVSKLQSEVEIDDPRDHSVGTYVLGQQITACDEFPFPPNVRLSSPNSFNFIEVRAAGVSRRRANITLYVTRFRDIAYPPDHDNV